MWFSNLVHYAWRVNLTGPRCTDSRSTIVLLKIVVNIILAHRTWGHFGVFRLLLAPFASRIYWVLFIYLRVLTVRPCFCYLGSGFSSWNVKKKLLKFESKTSQKSKLCFISKLENRVAQCRKTVMTPFRNIQGTRNINGYFFYENLRPNQQLDALGYM